MSTNWADGNGNRNRANPEVIDLRTPPTADAAVAELCDGWSRTSRDRLALTRQRWYHPATTGLVRALFRGTGLEAALAALGEARASAGYSLKETLADLAVLHELVTEITGERDHAFDSLSTAACVGSAWAEAYYGSDEPAGCVDELTGLVTAPFLAARLEQIYRHCSYLGMRPGEAYAAVVAQIGRHHPSPFTRVAQRLRLAGDLRLYFPGSDTLAVFEPTATTQTMVALTSRGPGLTTAVDGIAVGDGHRRVWIETLPDGVDDALRLIRQLPDTGG